MNSKVIVDTSLIDEILLDVLVQAIETLGKVGEPTRIDNQCISAYEEACDYLTERGYLQTKNGRIYTLVKVEKNPK